MKLSHMNTEPMNNLCLGTCLAAMTPMLLGLVHDAAFVGLAPWITISFIIMIISLIYMIKNKQFVPATANAIASAILLGQNLVNGFIQYGFYLTAGFVPAEISASLNIACVCPMLTSACLLYAVAFLQFKAKAMLGGVMLCVAAAGFGCMGIFFLGINALFGMIGGILLVVFGIYMIVPAGIVAMVKEAKQMAMEAAEGDE